MLEMGFLDFLKNLLGKKEPPPASPSESGAEQAQPTDGQFMNPQNPATNQAESEPTENPKN